MSPESSHVLTVHLPEHVWSLVPQLPQKRLSIAFRHTFISVVLSEGFGSVSPAGPVPFSDGAARRGDQSRRLSAPTRSFIAGRWPTRPTARALVIYSWRPASPAAGSSGTSPQTRPPTPPPPPPLCSWLASAGFTAWPLHCRRPGCRFCRHYGRLFPALSADKTGHALGLAVLDVYRKPYILAASGRIYFPLFILSLRRAHLHVGP